MHKNSRAYNIYKAGAAELGFEPNPVNDAYLQAIASMIDYATKPRATKKREEAATKPTLGFQVDDLLLACGIDPVGTPGPFFGRLGKLCHDLKVKASDLAPLKEHVFNRVRPWCEENDIPISADTVLKRLPKWLAAAREATPAVPTSAPERFR